MALAKLQNLPLFTSLSLLHRNGTPSLLWSKACIPGCTHAGDFTSFKLRFISADIEQRVVDKMLYLMSSNMASLMHATAQLTCPGCSLRPFSRQHAQTVCPAIVVA